MRIHNIIKPLRLLLCLNALSATVTSCGPKNQVSRTDSVAIDQTAIRNQYRVGFCWAYATVGLIESKYKMDTGKTLDLSEEAIGFHRMAEELLRDASAYQSGRITLTQATDVMRTTDDLQGWFVLSGSQNQRGGMELVDAYGVVPESAWSFKFRNSDDFVRLKRAALPAYQALLTQNHTITIRDVEQALVGPGAFPSVPPTSFTFEGQTITATGLARDIIKFRSSDYREVAANSLSDAGEVVAATKRALARGISVPLSYPADQSFIQNGVYRSTSTDPLPNRKTGHAVLITDFVNNGGHEGAMPADELRTELSKGFESLAFLKFKNSWGLQARTNESGIPVSEGSEGYYYLAHSYIEAISSMGFFRVIVPADIANDPFGQEPINPKVTTGT